MSKIIESRFGTLVDTRRVALGAASNVVKKGAFYVFSIRLEADDIREYSFTNRQRAVSAREVNYPRKMVDHISPIDVGNWIYYEN